MGHKTLQVVLGAPWLGHGRYTEAALSGIYFLYGSILMLAPEIPLQRAKVTWNVLYLGQIRILASVILIVAFFSATGLIMNVLGHATSRIWRFIGALMGMFIWVFLAANLIAAQDYATPSFACAVIFVLSTLRIMILSRADLPSPGVPGQI